MQRARKKYPEAKPRITSDSGPQFIARDFKGVHPHRGDDPCTNLVRLSAIEWQTGTLHKSLKSECVRPGTQLTREDAVRLIQTYVDHHNTVRLLSAIGYVTPHDMLVGRQSEIQPHMIASSRKRDTNASSGGQQDRCLHIHRTRLL